MSAKKIGTDRQLIRVAVDPEHYGATAEEKTACMVGLAAAGISGPDGRRRLQGAAVGWILDMLESYRKKGAEILERRKSDDRVERYRNALDELEDITGKAVRNICDALELAGILIAEPEAPKLKPYVVTVQRGEGSNQEPPHNKWIIVDTSDGLHAEAGNHDSGADALSKVLEEAHQAGVDGRPFELVEEVKA